MFNRHLLALAFLLCFPFHNAVPQALTISDNGRYIEKEDGTPFFWLGDTCWELLHRATQEDADWYLENRAAKGFTVIQTVIIAGLNTSENIDGLSVPNAYGELPLINRNPAQPNEQYFEHIDYIVDKANSLGMYVGLLPSWGTHVVGKGSVFTPEKASQYGRFLGKRYKDKSVVWILGGDNIPKNKQHFALFRSIARGLEEGHQNSQLMTYHPWGENTSANFFHQDEWLDFNMFQSGHARPDHRVYELVQRDYERTPPKPVLDGEPNYEDHPINWEEASGWFDEFDSRRAGYWAMLAGACGHTYGHGSIWQLWQKGREPMASPRTWWTEALDHPGAFQAGYMRDLFESRPWQQLAPDQKIIIEGPNAAGKAIVAATAQDSSFLMAYAPYGSNFRLSLKKINADSVRAWWFNPRDRTTIRMGKIKKADDRVFDPPADERRGNDWVLVLDDARRNHPTPGQPREN